MSGRSAYNLGNQITGMNKMGTIKVMYENSAIDSFFQSIGARKRIALVKITDSYLHCETKTSVRKSNSMC
jgi:hypothetical protein